MLKVARKSVKQRCDLTPASDLPGLMENFRRMVNDCVRIGLEHRKGVSLKQLSNLAYGELRDEYDNILSYYKLCAISKAAGILSARKKSIARGFATKKPYLSKPLLVSCYGFKIEKGSLLIPVGGRRFERIPLNDHTLTVVSEAGAKVRSFTLTEGSVSLCIAKEVDEILVQGMIGVDRNLGNVTAGNDERVTYFGTAKVVQIGESTTSIIRSLRRNDSRTRERIASKYGRRRRERIGQILSRISKDLVTDAKRNKQAIAFEDIRSIRRLYRRGNGQRRAFRQRMNSWPFHELKRQVEYKAAWEGVPVITLSVSETRGTTMECPRCGERLQLATRGDAEHRRQLWCTGCRRWMDRDLVAVLNISRRGWVRFAQSKGEAGEAVKGNPQKERGSKEPVILRVDASKLGLRHQDEELAEPKS